MLTCNKCYARVRHLYDSEKYYMVCKKCKGEGA